MTINTSIHYHEQRLFVDSVPIEEIVQAVGTPVYIYSLKRVIDNYQRIKDAYALLDTHIHYSAKANANLAIMQALISAGAGIDTVSGGEIFKALKAGAKPEAIVFAGVGKTRYEIQFALEKGIGWFNVENIEELQHINQYADAQNPPNVALRLNPDITANTHPHIATGHGAAKFGLTADTITEILKGQSDYPNLRLAGIHVHIGSQLGDTNGTVAAIEKALSLIEPYPKIRTINIGGGMPAKYTSDANLPSFEDFAHAIHPLLKDYRVYLEPGRSIIADAGILVGEILYIKEQAGQRILITDMSMTELMRPALYNALHEIIPVHENHTTQSPTQIVGPVCETTDVLGRNLDLPTLEIGEHLAILTAGAYGAVMASNYNARPRPAEVVVEEDGQTWRVVRQRETWDDLLQGEIS